MFLYVTLVIGDVSDCRTYGAKQSVKRPACFACTKSATIETSPVSLFLNLTIHIVKIVV